MEELYDYQKKVIEGIKRAKGNVLLQLPTGTGKTRICSEIVKCFMNEGKKIAIIIPNSFLRENVWDKELKKWGVDHSKVSVLERKDPIVRIREWGVVLKNKLSVISTPLIFTNDLMANKFNLSYFDLIILDEGHHSIAMNESLGYRINKNYLFLKDVMKGNNKLLISTIVDDSKRTKSIACFFRAERISDVSAETQEVKTHIIRINDPVIKEIYPIINERSVKELRYIKAIAPTASPFKMVEFLQQNKIEQKLSQKLKESSMNYLTLYNVLLDLKEDMVHQAKKRICYFFKDPKAKIRLLDKLNRIKRIKDQKIIEIVKKEEMKGVLIITRRREKADILKGMLEKEGIKSKCLMGGQENQKILSEAETGGVRVFILTPIGMEGLNLKNYNVLINITPYSDMFKKKQIKGRIRGGEQYFIIYDGFGEDNHLKNVESG